MIEIKDKRNCSGCHACANICPQHCIEMVADEEGFLYPKIDVERCIHCGLCDKICPILHKEKRFLKKPKAFAAYNNNLEIRMKSSSGGIFSLLAEYVIARGGVVFGVGFNEKFEVVHMAAKTKEDLEKLRVSKYVQSRIGECFKEAKSCLENGQTVLFTGTPCQIGGLLSFLRKPYENLITQDIICHGVPSPKVWEEYVKYREEKANCKTEKIAFRRKFNSWKKISFSFVFQDKSEYVKTPYFKDPMMKIFLFNKCLRPACHSCAFKDISRQSDITLADFWGIRSVCPEMDDDKGTSLVLLNSSKGEEIFEALKEKMNCKEVEFEKAVKHNPMIKRSARPFERKRFMNDFKKRPFAKVIEKYGKKIF